MGAATQPFFFRTRGTGGNDRVKVMKLQDEQHALRTALRAWRRLGPDAGSPDCEIHHLEVRDHKQTPICIFQYKAPPPDQ